MDCSVHADEENEHFEACGCGMVHHPSAFWSLLVFLDPAPLGTLQTQCTSHQSLENFKIMAGGQLCSLAKLVVVV